MHRNAVWSSQTIWLVIIATTTVGCTAEPESGSADHYQGDAEQIFGLTVAERTRTAIRQAAITSPAHQDLAAMVPYELAEAAAVKPIPLGRETDGVADAHVVVTPFVSTNASRVFLIMDIVERGEPSLETDPSGWQVLQSIAGLVELNAEKLQQVKLQLQAAEQSATNAIQSLRSDTVINFLRDSHDAWLQGLEVTSLQAWTLSAADVQAGNAPQWLTPQLAVDGTDLVQLASDMLAMSQFTNGPQGWLPLLNTGQVQVPPADQLAAWIAVVFLAGVAFAVLFAGVAILTTSSVAWPAFVIGVVVFLVVLAAIGLVGYCFVEQGMGRRHCMPRLRAIRDSIMP